MEKGWGKWHRRKRSIRGSGRKGEAVLYGMWREKGEVGERRSHAEGVRNWKRMGENGGGGLILDVP